ncbi:hypothetical protein Tco_1142604 [Tanacetum coccineum]
MKMEQYLQCIDYTLWEIVENGNAPIVTKSVDGKETVIPPTSVEEKAQRRAELKLLRTDLEQTYERLQKLISQLEIYGEVIPQEDINQNTNSTTRAVNTAQGVNTASTQGSADSSITAKNLSDACDGFGYDWSDQAEEGPTNFACMAYSLTSLISSINSELSNDSNYFSSRLECVKNLKEQNEQLVKDLRTARISDVFYKTGLEFVEARLLVFKKNDSVYEEDIKLLKCEIYLRDLDFTELKRNLELTTKEKDENFMPPKSDLVYPSLDDFVDVNESVSEPIVKKPTVETNEPKTARKENRAPIIEEWVSDSNEENVPKVKTIEMFNKPSSAKINFVKSIEM